jgi:hypothetical protein
MDRITDAAIAVLSEVAYRRKKVTDKRLKKRIINWFKKNQPDYSKQDFYYVHHILKAGLRYKSTTPNPLL